MAIVRMSHRVRLYERSPAFVSAHQMRDYARLFAPDAINLLVDVVHDQASPKAARVMAAKELLDRGFGKPMQQIVIDEIEDAKVIDMVLEAERSVGQVMSLPPPKKEDDGEESNKQKDEDGLQPFVRVNGHG